MRLLRYAQKINWGLLAPALLLSLLGLLSILSASQQSANLLDFEKQAGYLVLSLFLCLFISFCDFRFLKANSRLVFALYVLSLLSLLLLLFFGSTIRNVRGWYRFGPFSFDPEPLCAVVLIIVLSKYFSAKHIELKRFAPILVSALYVALPVFFILQQPDIGSALVFIAVWVGVVIFSGASFKNIAILFLIFCLLFSLCWLFLFKDYHKARILSFFNPDLDKQGVSWSVNQSKIAIGSGGILGKGFGKGSQTQLGFLSAPKTDFIFSAIAEEFGFVGLLVLFGSFFFLFYQIIRTAFTANNNFLRIFALGFAFLLLSQMFINIGMCLGLLPVIGIPLPFVSYGGSMLLGFYTGLGILISLTKYT